MRPWEMSEAQRQAAAKRADLVTLDEAIARLEAMLAEARDFAAHFEERRRVIHAKLAALHFRRYPVHMDAQGLPMSGPPPMVAAEHDALMRQLGNLDEEQRRQVDARRVSQSDGVIHGSWSPLSASDVERKLGRVRLIRNVAGAALRDLEGRLSAGELVQTGVEAPDLADHRERVAALRERLAEPQPAA